MRAVSLSRSASSVSLDGCHVPRSGAPIAEPRNLRKRISSMLLGVKGSMLPGNNLGVYGKAKEREYYKPENPVARLKLLLVSAGSETAHHFRHLTQNKTDRFVPHSTHPKPVHTAHATTTQSHPRRAQSRYHGHRDPESVDGSCRHRKALHRLGTPGKTAICQGLRSRLHTRDGTPYIVS